MFSKRLIYILLMFLTTGTTFFALKESVLSLTFEDPLQTGGDIQVVLGKIWKFLYMVALAIVPIMAIIAGFMFMTAGGNPEKLKKAKNLLLYLAIGIAIVLLAGGIVNLIKMILGVEG